MGKLKEHYQQTVRKQLQEKFQYANPMMVPRLEKVVVSMGVGEATRDRNVIADHQRELAMITGQQPMVTKARKSISNFKLREGQAIGLKVTLRGKRMYDFMERFIHIAGPRIRDFRGFRGGCDGRGNYSIGLESQDIFPEVNLDQMKRMQGMNLTLVTTANRDEECLELLGGLGMPMLEKK